MLDGQLRLILLVGIITILSGLADSWAVVHASRSWQGGMVVWSEVGRASLGFMIGIALYWLSLRYMAMLGITTPELPTILWMVVVLLAVVVTSRHFLTWALIDQFVALLVVWGIGFLLFRLSSQQQA